MTSYVMGIDGGASTLRVAIVSPDLAIHAQAVRHTSVNPYVVDEMTARNVIQGAMQEAINQANLSRDDIAAIGIGIAGASAEHSADWLRRVVNKVLTTGKQRHKRLVLSSDHEIALVGAHGERRGILVLAGTGSLAYGVSSTGETVLVGALGYLLGDEGSGYWLGLAGLRAAIRHADSRGPFTSLAQALLAANHLENHSDLIAWTYSDARNREIAEFARVVLDHAAQGDRIAREIIDLGARELALAAKAVRHRLHMEALPVAFAGGLLSSPNPLSEALCDRLGLAEFPVSRYPPVVGAALLAMQRLNQAESEVLC